MPFDWMHPVRVAPSGDPFAEQIRRAAEERARLLCNLGYDVDEATRRIKTYLEWEFDKEVWAPHGGSPVKRVDQLVKQVYGRARASDKVLGRL